MRLRSNCRVMHITSRSAHARDGVGLLASERRVVGRTGVATALTSRDERRASIAAGYTANMTNADKDVIRRHSWTSRQTQRHNGRQQCTWGVCLAEPVSAVQRRVDHTFCVINDCQRVPI